MKNVVICIDDDNTIRCNEDDGTVIDVRSATYGRNSIRKCPTGNVGTSSCGPVSILKEVQSRCNGKQVCKIIEPPDDPCPGTTKYFMITYHCIKE